jgi:hypothetical protein
MQSKLDQNDPSQGTWGLGVLHVEKFARALRLRWLWQEWACPDKAWAGKEVPCDDDDSCVLGAGCGFCVNNYR